MKKNKLHNIKDTGFKIPENYFDSFETRLNNRLLEAKPILEIESTGFCIPEDYFEMFEANLLETIKTKNHKPVITLKSRQTLYYFSGIAASLILILSLVFNNLNNFSIDSLDTAAIENYIYQEEYTNNELAALFITDEISETDFIDLEISDETLNQYLENTDTEDLIIE